MRLHRFYIPGGQMAGGKHIEISTAEQLHQWKNVFRLGEDDEIIVFNGEEDTEYRAKFISLTKKDAELEIVEKKAVAAGEREVNLYVTLIKKEHFEWMLEKVTELGVSKITPIISERTEVKNFNQERAEKIIIEAVEQSGRVQLPELSEALPLAAALEQAKNPFVCEIGEKKVEGDDKIAAKTIDLFIGPEGGWSPVEKDLFANKKVPTVSFGTWTLRAETAAIVAVALSNFLHFQ